MFPLNWNANHISLLVCNPLPNLYRFCLWLDMLEAATCLHMPTLRQQIVVERHSEFQYFINSRSAHSVLSSIVWT
jgi:hypothetical protein